MMGDSSYKDYEQLTTSFETPDLMSLQSKAIESATILTIPGSIHFGRDTQGNHTFTGKVGLPRHLQHRSQRYLCL